MEHFARSRLTRRKHRDSPRHRWSRPELLGRNNRKNPALPGSVPYQSCDDNSSGRTGGEPGEKRAARDKPRRGAETAGPMAEFMRGCSVGPPGLDWKRPPFRGFACGSPPATRCRASGTGASGVGAMSGLGIAGSAGCVQGGACAHPRLICFMPGAAPCRGDLIPKKPASDKRRRTRKQRRSMSSSLTLESRPHLSRNWPHWPQDEFHQWIITNLAKSQAVWYECCVNKWVI